MRQFGPRLADEIVKTDPQEVKAAAAQMFAYELPPGYREQMVMNSFGMRALTISGEPGAAMPMSITVTQINNPYLARQRRAQPAMPDVGKWLELFGVEGMQMENLPPHTYTIAGSPVTFTGYEMIANGDPVMRQIIGEPFVLDERTFTIQVTGPAGDDWDDDGLEAFFASIH
jgi:hypothetical protein